MKTVVLSRKLNNNQFTIIYTNPWNANGIILRKFYYLTSEKGIDDSHVAIKEPVKECSIVFTRTAKPLDDTLCCMVLGYRKIHWTHWILPVLFCSETFLHAHDSFLKLQDL